MMFDGLGSSAAHIKAGRIKGLAVASDKRAPGFPDLPTTAELGLASYQVATWYGLWAPKGTPKDVVERIQAELRKALELRGAAWPSGAASARSRPTCTARPTAASSAARSSAGPRWSSPRARSWSECLKLESPT